MLYMYYITQKFQLPNEGMAPATRGADGALRVFPVPPSSVGGKAPVGAPFGLWTLQPGGLNCYDGHGAAGASADPHANSIALDDCKAACQERQTSGCRSIVVEFEAPSAMRAWSNDVKCYLRGVVQPEDCVHAAANFELYTLDIDLIPTPPMLPPPPLPPFLASPPSPPPTTDPGQRDCLAPKLCDTIRHSSIYPQWSLVSTRGWIAGADDEPRASTNSTSSPACTQPHVVCSPPQSRAVQTLSANSLTASGTFLCYSGLQTGARQSAFSADRQTGLVSQLKRQLKLVRALRRAKGTGGIFVAMSMAGTDSFRTEATIALQNEPGVEMVVVANRNHDNHLNANDSWIHPQLLGVRHCGIIARKLEKQRGAPLKFAVRMRYDLNLHFESVPLWPIWFSHEADLLAFGKSNRCTEMSCMPQDVFFVARRNPAVTTWSESGAQACTDGSVACAFEGEYRASMVFTTRDLRDQFEAALFSPWFHKGASMFTIWQCATPPCSMHELPCSEKGWCLEDAGTVVGPRSRTVNETCAGMGWCDKHAESGVVDQQL